ncbi:MAG TPA: MmcQ/YjbR family DNA-binding protein [Phycisphaerae bacterium]|jgi:uncharacterized protein YndB with AHSA1/START domain/predicted DNA-binding protein (MmcQ/YjbR family)
MKNTAFIQQAEAALRRSALAYPESYEEFPWGHRAIKVARKVFVFMSADETGLSIGTKLPHSNRAALAKAFAEPTGYGLGKSGWVTARFGPRAKPPLELLRTWIDESYRAVAPKALSALLPMAAAEQKTGEPDVATKSKRKLMRDAAVQAKTGKNWSEWFSILDRAGAKKKTHKEIVACLAREHGVGPWWQQMITVGYEQQRGLRKPHQRPDGYSISRSKTIAAPVARLFAAWQQPRTRSRWLGESSLTIRTATRDKSLRITWPNPPQPDTTIEVMFYPKGEAKAQVVVQHNKLPDAKSAERMKKFWAEKFERLTALVTA